MLHMLIMAHTLSAKNCERDQAGADDISLLFKFGAEGATPPETLRQKDRKFFDILESRLDGVTPHKDLTDGVN